MDQKALVRIIAGRQFLLVLHFGTTLRSRVLSPEFPHFHRGHTSRNPPGPRIGTDRPISAVSIKWAIDQEGAFEKVLLTSAICCIRLYLLPPGPGTSSAARPEMNAITLNNPAARAAQERWERLRSHKRIISRVKLLVEWEESGSKAQANAVTVDVSHSGCMAVVGADLPLHKRVRLVHPETGRKADAEVVWRSHEAWDAGFELVKPDASFWGLK
jgi:hypothetical protein